MTLDEARKVAHVAGTADDGCPVCVGSMVDELNEAFPEFVWSRVPHTIGEPYPDSNIAVTLRD